MLCHYYVSHYIRKKVLVGLWQNLCQYKFMVYGIQINCMHVILWSVELW